MFAQYLVRPVNDSKIGVFVPLYTADALVLRTYKLGEADRIVVFLTRDRGKKRGVAKGARRPRSRFTGALEPMTEVAGGVLREGAARAGRAELRGDGPVAAAHERRRADPERRARSTASSYFAELLDEWAQEADADDRLYRLGASMLDALAAGAPVEPLARYFEYWLLRLQGVYPEVARHAVGRGAGVSGGVAHGGAARRWRRCRWTRGCCGNWRACIGR